MFIRNVDSESPLAFPNAYISTDEPPRRSVARRALCLLAIGGVGFLGVVILTLSLVWTQYSPVSQFASDYGVGAYGPEMNAGFFLAGAGVLSLGLILSSSGTGKGSRAGGALLVLDGILLLASGYFQTDIEGAVATFHGLVHDSAGVTFFLTSPMALLLVGRGFGRRWFALLVAALAGAVAFVVANGVLSLGATGLAERLVVLVVFSSLIAVSASVYRRT